MPKQCRNKGCNNQCAFENTDECNNCWEVKRRLEAFLNTEAGMRYLRFLLHDVFNMDIKKL